MNQQLADRDLIARVLDGEDRAYEVLVDRYSQMVFTLAVRMLRDREVAEETAQDIFVKAYQSLSGYRGSARFSTWLYTIAYHRILDVAAREKRHRSYRTDELPEGRPLCDLEDTWSQLMEGERRDLILMALEELPEDDRLLISLFYLQEQSLREIAAITGIRAGTVKVRLFRARERLRDLISASAGYQILREYGR
ncbi:RNA polymerase sigma factor [Robiginitalea biformata]|uniref:RNA polymerase sigma-70 factor, ECF subfamily protein n=1 Tax=Robiginitalea biformata (strain ATCC BAA-864 / DSM 15991 / KCTC 12146 / HTCC2501) TaxID=313596 RepID=A4CQ62_ROBBH|nr:sigma-70 family RNA polymerase sigma factor [Robiginitalea biformata]EAR14147.1 RNA polymerase sigma-70 factor, ECF subfamily protein [Robiginitalea biformata HTCC2501]